MRANASHDVWDKRTYTCLGQLTSKSGIISQTDACDASLFHEFAMIQYILTWWEDMHCGHYVSGMAHSGQGQFTEAREACLWDQLGAQK